LIISHKYKFIFIKTNKTAGTSIEIALSKICGDEDVITKFSVADEKVRSQLGYLGPQNYHVDRSRYDIRDWFRFIFNIKRREFTKHMSARDIKRYVGEEIWNSYYKFCVERNPWDRMISNYYWRRGEHRSEKLQGMSEFLESDGPKRLQRRGINLYTIDGEVVVDKICRFESLADELEEVRVRCNIPEKLVLPNAKGSFRKDRRNYKDILTSEQAEKIRKLSSREIALLGYEY
jgi:hypothetical protein